MSSFALPATSRRSTLNATASAALLPSGAGRSIAVPLRFDVSVQAENSPRVFVASCQSAVPVTRCSSGSWSSRLAIASCAVPLPETSKRPSLLATEMRAGPPNTSAATSRASIDSSVNVSCPVNWVSGGMSRRRSAFASNWYVPDTLVPPSVPRGVLNCIASLPLPEASAPSVK